MNIGIFKPGKTIFFYENAEDHASWSAEIIDICKLFLKHGHKVYIISNTDYKEGTIENLFGHIPDDIKLDKAFVFNGVFESPEHEQEVLDLFKTYTEDINFILSDMRLMTTNPQLYSKIFTQSVRLYEYGAIQEHCLIEREFDFNTEKTINYYFGGTERGRTKDFLEYVNKPECLWYGKSETLGVVNYIPYNEHIENLKKAKTTIIIADEEYNNNGFVNDRYYQCAKYDVICFADSKFDPDELIMSKDDWRRVSSYAELQTKQAMLNSDTALYSNVLQQQRLKLYGHSFGRNIYQQLISSK